jgi:hypothetical protein
MLLDCAIGLAASVMLIGAFGLLVVLRNELSQDRTGASVDRQRIAVVDQRIKRSAKI